jgi:glycosyltransferase involved in cell wall biosynthesis
MTSETGPLRVLHVLPSLGPTNAQYHEHCLPLLGERQFVICSLLPAKITPPRSVTLFTGDGSRLGPWRSLRAALRHGRYDVIHAHVPISAALLAAAVTGNRRARGASVYSMTNSYRSYKLRNRLLLYPIFAVFPEIVLCADAVRESLPAPLAWLGRRKFTVVPNGVDAERARQVVAADGQGPRPDGFTVVSVSRMVPIKDPLTLLAAFERCREPSDRLVFVGDGPLRPVVAAAADRAGLDSQVQLTGLIPRDDVYRQMAAGDVYVSVSHGEGLPVAVLEAMACGRPVILSDIPPHREIAQDADFIPLVAPGDVDGLTRELARMRDLPPDQRADVGTWCQKIVDQRYGVAVMHRSLAVVYDRARRRAVSRGDGTHE